MAPDNLSGLIEKYRTLQDLKSMTVKIRHDQVCEIVVADLMAKYKACTERNDEYKDAFAKVLRFYIDEEEFQEIARTRKVFVTVLTFYQPLQPQMVTVGVPEL